MNKQLLERIQDLSGILLERLSSIVYHNTYISRVVDILKENRMIAGTAVGADKVLGKPFFIALSRVKFGGYARSLSNTEQACIVLDGDKLNQNYKGVSVDYWGESWREAAENNVKDAYKRYEEFKEKLKDPDYARAMEKFGKTLKDFENEIDYNRKVLLRNNENEERILLDKPYIDNIKKYIKEIHILNIKPDTEEYSEVYTNALHNIGTIAKYCNSYNIPLYTYDNLSSYIVQRKGKELKDYTPDFVRLIKAYEGDYDAIKDFGYFLEDKAITIKNEIHRPQKPYLDDLTKFAKILKKENTDILGLLKLVNKKRQEYLNKKEREQEEAKTVEYYINDYRPMAEKYGMEWLEQNLRIVDGVEQSYPSGWQKDSAIKKKKAIEYLMNEVRMKELANV